jgi:uncharacterized protein
MKVTGTASLSADRETVWRALNDPAVLVRTIPGCQRLEAQGADAYSMRVAAGVGSIKGVYDGQVRLTDQEEPGSFRMHADGAGAAGTIATVVAVSLTETETGGTTVTYDADATVGGMIGGVGQRMLAGVSKRMAAEFFANVDAALGPAPSTVAPPPALAAPSAPPGTMFTAPTERRGGEHVSAFAKGVAVGAVAALAGAVVGAWIRGRVR